MVSGKVDEKLKKILDEIKNLALQMRKTANVKTVMVSGGEILELIVDKLGFLKLFTTIEEDRKFSVILKDELDRLIASDISMINGWIQDISDCDNIAHNFKDWMDILYKVTGIGVAYGKLYLNSTLLGLHAFNLIAIENSVGDLDLLVYEPQIANYAEARPKTRIGAYVYEVDGSTWY